MSKVLVRFPELNESIECENYHILPTIMSFFCEKNDHVLGVSFIDGSTLLVITSNEEKRYSIKITGKRGRPSKKSI